MHVGAVDLTWEWECMIWLFMDQVGGAVLLPWQPHGAGTVVRG